MTDWLIVNPSAGAGLDGPNYPRLRKLAAARGLVIHETDRSGDARRLARDAVHAGVRTVVAAGGDGTLSEVINGLSTDFSCCRLAVVPLGTANDFARTLQLPQGDPEAALALLDTGTLRAVDVVRAAGLGPDAGPPRYLVNAATGGFSEVVHQHLDRDLKQRWGALAYLRAALDAMPEACYHDVRLEIDDQPVLRERSCALVVANGRSAGGMLLAPQASLHDEHLDLVIVRTESWLDQLRLASRFLLGTHLDSEDIGFHQAKVVRIDADSPMKFSADGELVGQTPIEFRVVPHALRIHVPPGTDTPGTDDLGTNDPGTGGMPPAV